MDDSSSAKSAFIFSLLVVLAALGLLYVSYSAGMMDPIIGKMT